MLTWLQQKARRLFKTNDETPPWFLHASSTSYTGKAVSTQSALHYSTVFACTRVLSESVGMLPCHLYQSHAQHQTLATQHRLYRLLKIAPNSFMTAQEFWELLTTCLALRGNFYAYKVHLYDEVTELLPLDPSRVQVQLGPDWEPVYTVSFQEGRPKILSQDKIWHVRILTLDGLRGLNPIAYARESIALGLATEEHGSKLFQNGATPSGVLQTDQKLTAEAYKRLQDDFNAKNQGLDNAHKPMILEMGLNWKPISLNAEDSQFLETRKFQRDEICSIYRVPPHLIANLERATFNNIEHLGMSFVNYSLIPYLTRIEQRILVGLLTKSEQTQYVAKFNVGALLRGDLKTRYESYGHGINWGILSPNECRKLEDMDPREGGDVYLTPLNMRTGNADETKE